MSEKLTRYFWSRGSGRPLNKQRQQSYDDVMAWAEVKLIHEGQADQNPQNWFNHNPEQIWLEIGFGNGEHLHQHAQWNPNVGLIGCEPFVNGVSMLCKDIDEHDTKNIRIWQEDARVLLQSLAPNSIDRCFVLFPDPWPKSKHHKRRIINAETLDWLAVIMKQDGQLRMATDHAGLAEWMLYHAVEHPKFEWSAQAQEDWKTEPKDWVRTRYQEKAKAGTENWFLDFTRI